MKKTHKKILGFAGLGLVAAVTVAAAVMPSPNVSALTMSDTIQVHVTNNQPEMSLTTSSKSEIKDPSYSFTLGYNKLSSVKVTLVNKNVDGGIINQTVLWDAEVGGVEGTKTFDLNLDEYGGYGDFTITAVGLDAGGVPIEKSLAVSYIETSSETTPGDDGKAEIDIDIPKEQVISVTMNLYTEGGELLKTFDFENPGKKVRLDLSDLEEGTYILEIIYKNQYGDVLAVRRITIVVSGDKQVDVDLETEIDTVTTIETYIYDEDGEIKRTIRVSRENCELKIYNEKGDLISTYISQSCKNGKLEIPMEGLESGEYTAVIMFKNKYGYLVGNTRTIKIKWDAEKGIIVPDTGSFFQGLNISREDYLITGLAIFMIVGVVAFGVVKKTRSNR